jgi:hypothetical protein
MNDSCECIRNGCRLNRPSTGNAKDRLRLDELSRPQVGLLLTVCAAHRRDTDDGPFDCCHTAAAVAARTHAFQCFSLNRSVRLDRIESAESATHAQRTDRPTYCSTSATPTPNRAAAVSCCGWSTSQVQSSDVSASPMQRHRPTASAVQSGSVASSGSALTSSSSVLRQRNAMRRDAVAH